MGSEVKVVIEHAPVKITTLVDGVEAVVFNANGAFEFERRKTKSEEDAPPARTFSGGGRRRRARSHPAA